MHARLRAVAHGISGSPPPKGSSRLQILRWIRRCYLRSLLWMTPMYVFVAFFVRSAWIWLLAGAGLFIWLAGLVLVSVDLRRSERARKAA
jgi:hypothetical protein